MNQKKYIDVDTDSELFRKMVAILKRQINVDESEIVPNARFGDDMGADSLDQIELVMAAEEEFGLEINDEEAVKLQTVRDAYEYIDDNWKR